MAVTIRWVGYPASWTRGRRLKIKAIILHTTEGSEGTESAEAGADYDKRRDDEVSTHYFTDAAGPALQEVPDGDRAHTARQHGNEIGVQIEMCGRAGQSAQQWDDDASRKTLRTTAALVAILLVRHSLPLRRLTVAELRAAYYSNATAVGGICDHYTATRAFPEDRGTHTDVGQNFPWDRFFEMIREEMGGAPVPPVGSDDMATVFLWKSNIWISRGDAKEREIVCPNPPGTTRTPEANVVTDAHRVYPERDTRGYPAIDLTARGWTEALVDLTFGPIKGTAVDDTLSAGEIDAIGASVAEHIGEGFTQEVALTISGSGRAITTAAPAGE